MTPRRWRQTTRRWNGCHLSFSYSTPFVYPPSSVCILPLLEDLLLVFRIWSWSSSSAMIWASCWPVASSFVQEFWLRRESWDGSEKSRRLLVWDGRQPVRTWTQKQRVLLGSVTRKRLVKTQQTEKA
jgi:hypothetical protein